MKTTILPIIFLLALLPITPSHAQWQEIDPDFPDSLDLLCWGLSVVNENVVWANALQNKNIDFADFPERQYFYKTTDGGQTWKLGEIKNALHNWRKKSVDDLFALDSNTAWALNNHWALETVAGSSHYEFDSTEILKTIDGGETWAHQTLPVMHRTSLMGIRFFNQNEGAIWGEASDGGFGTYPVGWHIECYYTEDGGDTWQLAVSPSSMNEGWVGEVLNPSGIYEVLGNNIWFGTNKGRVFHSKDRGKTWEASAPAWPGRAIVTFAFRDSLNGIGFSTADSAFNILNQEIVFHTQDGGKNWIPQPPRPHTNWLTDLECIPGSGGVYWYVSGNNCDLSTDNGNTWTFQTTPRLLWFAEFLSPKVGWAASAFHPTPPTSKLFMYKWVGDSLLRDERLNATKTLAGSGIEGHLDGASKTARFYNPKGMAIDGAGNVFVADDYNHCIRKITMNGQASTLAGTGVPGYANGPGASAQFNRPQDLVLDSDGNLYVADANNYAIRKIAPDGSVSLWAGTPGVSGETDGPALQASFGWPSALSKDETGNLYVGGSTTIRKVSTGGEVSTLHTAAGAVPCLDADRYGNVYFADEATLSVRKRRLDGQISVLAGNGSGCMDGNGTTVEFGSIDDLDADDFGAVYIADGLNASIRKVDSLGNTVTLAGADCLNPIFLEQQPADGSGTLAQLGRLRGILLKPSGNLLATSWDNDMVREITLGSGAAKQIVVKSSHISPIYKTTPLAQLQPMAFSGEILNYSQETLTHLRMSVSIKQNGANVWQNNSPLATLPPDSSAILDGGNFQLSSVGVYNVTLDYKQVASSFFTFQEELTVSDSILAADDGLEYEFDGIGGVAAYGQMFHIPFQDTLTGFSLKARLENASFCFSVYNFNGENLGALIYTSDTLQGVSGSHPFEYYHYLPTSLALPAGNYLFVVSKTNTNGAFGMGVDTDRNDQSAWYRSLDDNVESWTPLHSLLSWEKAPVYMIRPVFGKPGVTVTGTKEATAPGFQVQISPNPTTGIFALQINGASTEQFLLQVVDMNGRLVEALEIQGNTASVSVADLSAGSYFIKVFNEKGMAVARLVKI